MAEQAGASPEAGYKVVHEGGEKALKINYENTPLIPSLEDESQCMLQVFDLLTRVGRVHRIVFLQKEEFVYDFEQVKLLEEIVEVYIILTKKENVMELKNVEAVPGGARFIPAWRELLRRLIMHQLKEDPVGAYVNLKRTIRDIKIKQKNPPLPNYVDASNALLDVLEHAEALLKNTRLIKLAESQLEGYEIGKRELYREFFKPSIRPYFMYTKLVTGYPAGAEELASYKLGATDVMILKLPEDIRPLYHIVPPEFKMGEEKYDLLTAAREVMAEHSPQRSEFIQPERTREIFFTVERDLLEDLSKTKGLNLTYKELDELAHILVRYTIGFGLIEVLLQDPNIQDIMCNAPMGTQPISLIHGDFGECRTNITPTMREGASWATKLRLLSGRPLDEANPVLDSDLWVPGGKARVAALQQTLSPGGLAFAFRRHRDKPWTLPLFIQNKMLNPLAAGLLSFLIDGARTILIAGTRSSGKTSLLGALMVEVMRSNRVITCEDSVAGDCQILVRRNGILQKTKVGEFIDEAIRKYGFEEKLGREITKNIPEKIEILTSDAKGKIKFASASSFIRHKVTKPIYQITTATGKRIKVTGDHSLFSIGQNTVLEETKAGELNVGDFIATPRILPIENERGERINLLEHAGKLGELFAKGSQIKSIVEQHWTEIKKLAKAEGYSKGGYAAWKRNAILPLKILDKLSCEIEPRGIELKAWSSSKPLPALLELDKDFLTFIGLWLADGCYDKSAVIVSACESEEREVVQRLAAKLDLPVHLHSDKFSLMLDSKVLKEIMQNVLDLRGTAFTKKIPSWAYELSQNQIACVLRGVFSGDGCAADKEVILASSSPELLKDLQTLLLSFGVILRVRQTMRSDKTYNASISALKFLKLFRDKIGFLQKTKTEKLEKLCSKISTHDSTDVIPLSQNVKLELSELCKEFNKHDYLTRENNIGREHLSDLISTAPENALLNPLRYLAESDIFWDRVIGIEELGSSENYVYDISVPETENFVCENIIAHNTLELPVSQLRQLNYDILPLKVRSVITATEAEVPAEQGIRTALRLGDSALIVGEVRSKEALALYEAMRVGALAKVVAGTIHGDSPYGVFDRVVNDLGVPRTSFKATDIIAVANPVKSASGMGFIRRLVQVAEVRKFWDEDPLRERGFADLMAYDAKTDSLEGTDVLLEGESEIIKAIGGKVKGWAGNWQAIWENIELRAKIKQAIVDVARKSGDASLLEADFVVRANDQFHLISEVIEKEVGVPEAQRVYSEWNAWLDAELKKRARNR